jgi:hypothetical protein
MLRIPAELAAELRETLDTLPRLPVAEAALQDELSATPGAITIPDELAGALAREFRSLKHLTRAELALDTRIYRAGIAPCD